MSTDEQGQGSIHERLYKQETMCKKIASQLRRGIDAGSQQDGGRRGNSASRAAVNKTRSVEKLNYSYE